MAFLRWSPFAVAVALSGCSDSPDPSSAGSSSAADDDDDDDDDDDGDDDDAGDGDDDTGGNDDATPGDDDGGDDDPGGGVWRPFASDSPWNQKIPDDAPILAESDALIQDLATSSMWPGFTVNIDSWGIPAFEASPDTPLRTVTLTDVVGYGMDEPMPIPLDAEPDAEGDHHLCVVDREANLTWDLWNARHDGNAWTAGVGARIELDGSGVRPPKDGNQAWQWSHGSRACGFPLIAGLIRVEEIQAGRIEHALVLAYPHIRSHYYTPPASTAQGTTNEALPDRGMPCGMRVQLDPTIDVEALDLAPAGKIIARALQEYGAYVADYGGAISLYADGSPEAVAYWQDDVLSQGFLMPNLDPAWLRVIEPYGPIYEDQN
jgi:hypothetical protein